MISSVSWKVAFAALIQFMDPPHINRRLSTDAPTIEWPVSSVLWAAAGCRALPLPSSRCRHHRSNPAEDTLYANLSTNSIKWTIRKFPVKNWPNLCGHVNRTTPGNIKSILFFQNGMRG